MYRLSIFSKILFLSSQIMMRISAPPSWNIITGKICKTHKTTDLSSNGSKNAKCTAIVNLLSLLQNIQRNKQQQTCNTSRLNLLSSKDHVTSYLNLRVHYFNKQHVRTNRMLGSRMLLMPPSFTLILRHRLEIVCGDVLFTFFDCTHWVAIPNIMSPTRLTSANTKCKNFTHGYSEMAQYIWQNS
jgi:hypothetical protein